MLDADLKPTLLEVTFSPNLESITAINKNFVNEVFRCLYLGEEERVVRIM